MKFIPLLFPIVIALAGCGSGEEPPVVQTKGAPYNEAERQKAMSNIPDAAKSGMSNPRSSSK